MVDYLRPVGTLYKDRYQVVRTLSDKGMSYVYACMDQELNRLVVLKEVIKARAGRENINYHAILNEAELMSRLSHPGIPRILDRSETDDRVSVLMDLVSGEDLGTIIKRDGPFDEKYAVAKLIQLATIMAYLHQNSIFYRDLKPSNVLLQDGNIRLLDFGISVRVTRDNAIIKQGLGTKGYAAPEQGVEGSPYDLRSDIYSFGATAFTLMTGKSPLETRNIMTLTRFRPGASIGLSNVLDKCVARDPQDRFQSFEEVIAALRNYNSFDEAVHASARRKIRLTRANFLLAGVLALSSGAVGALGVVKTNNEYSSILEKAQKSGALSDYASAIKAKPSNLDPYFDVINQIKSGDGVFTPEEESAFIPLVTTNSESLRGESRYPELAFNIGQLYWFFYQSPSDADGRTLAAPWFKDAVEGKYNVEQSSVFYSMSSFNRDIAAAVQTSSDTGMYRAYWNNLRSLDVSNVGEVAVLQLYSYTLDCINSYTYRLQTDGVPYDEIQDKLKEISGYLKSHSKPTPGRPEELTKEIQEKLIISPSLVDPVYGKVN